MKLLFETLLKTNLQNTKTINAVEITSKYAEEATTGEGSSMQTRGSCTTESTNVATPQDAVLTNIEATAIGAIYTHFIWTFMTFLYVNIF